MQPPARMFIVRKFVPQFEVSFLYITHHAETGSFCFRLFCYSMGAIISLFSLVFLLDLCYILTVSEWSVCSMEQDEDVTVSLYIHYWIGRHYTARINPSDQCSSRVLVPGTKFFFKKAMVKASIGELSPPTQFMF